MIYQVAHFLINILLVTVMYIVAVTIQDLHTCLVGYNAIRGGWFRWDGFKWVWRDHSPRPPCPINFPSYSPYKKCVINIERAVVAPHIVA